MEILIAASCTFKVKQLEAAGVSVSPFGRNNAKFFRDFKANFTIGNVEVRILSGQPRSAVSAEDSRMDAKSRDLGVILDAKSLWDDKLGLSRSNSAQSLWTTVRDTRF